MHYAVMIDSSVTARVGVRFFTGLSTNNKLFGVDIADKATGMAD
jgi:hypothetical protein